MDRKPVFGDYKPFKMDRKPNFTNQNSYSSSIDVKRNLSDDDSNSSKKPVSILHEMMAKKQVVPEYKLLHCSTNSCGSVPNFTYEVSVDGMTATGRANKKKNAKHAAAQNMLIMISKKQDSKTLAKKIAKPSIISDSFVENYVGSLQRFTGLNRIKTPHYSIPKAEGPAHFKIFRCKCTVMLRHPDKSIDILEEEGVAATLKLSKQAAAKLMRERLVKLLPDAEDPEREITKEELMKTEVKDEIIKPEFVKKEKIEIPFEGPIVDYHLSDHEDTESEPPVPQQTRVKTEPGLEMDTDQNHSRIPDLQSQIVNETNLYNQPNTEIPQNVVEQRREEIYRPAVNSHLYDPQDLESPQNMEQRRVDIDQPAEYLHSPNNDHRRDEEIIPPAEQTDFVKSEYPKKEKKEEDWVGAMSSMDLNWDEKSPVIDSEERREENSEEIGRVVDEPERPMLSKYHHTMLTYFGLDLRENVFQQMRELVRSMVNSKKSEEPYFIDHQLTSLDAILAIIGVEVNSTVFEAHDGRFIMLIQVTTIPEILEVDESRKRAGLGVGAFFNVIERLKKLMK